MPEFYICIPGPIPLYLYYMYICMYVSIYALVQRICGRRANGKRRLERAIVSVTRCRIYVPGPGFPFGSEHWPFGWCRPYVYSSTYLLLESRSESVNEQALVCLYNRENLDVRRGRLLNYKMANNHFFSHCVGLIYLSHLAALNYNGLGFPSLHVNR